MAQTTIRSQALQYVTGSISTKEYLTINLGNYSQAMDTLEHLPPSSKTVMLFEPRGLYCLPNCLSDDHLDRWKQIVYSKESFADIIEKWKKDGYTHILFGKLGADFMRSSHDPHYTQKDWELLDDFLSNLPLSPANLDHNYYILYSIP